MTAFLYWHELSQVLHYVFQKTSIQAPSKGVYGLNLPSLQKLQN